MKLSFFFITLLFALLACSLVEGGKDKSKKSEDDKNSGKPGMDAWKEQAEKWAGKGTEENKKSGKDA